MSILGSIISKIFSHSTSSTSSPPTTPSTPSSSAPAGGSQTVDVGAVMDNLAHQSKEKLDWKHSIVDMMKLLNLDSSLEARKQLAEELHYTGNMHDSAAMNVWLHAQVMKKLAENGGKLPPGFGS